ncbi:MAG: LLM class F420-dependent oxidoreductase [Candidatus Promineofilum sp.]|nr:LLM class F420-dependent oxidoreductase [Promineifilum sp.]
MDIGLVYPQIEYPTTPAAVRDYAQAAESLGFTHILAYDHILGTNPDRPGGWSGPYTYRDPFMEPFLLFTYMAAVTTRLGFVTGILILPQRETTLVAKQAAVLDVLCGGRLRLGVGTGWNEVEYRAAGYDFHTRGARQEEQIEVLRRLWTQELVTYHGRWHDIPDAGLNPLPVQRPIPIWLGGHADVVLRRIARLGDGWLPGFRTAEAARGALETLDGYLAGEGRSRADVGLEPRLHWGDGDLDALGRALEGWRTAGATHISLNTMGAGFTTAGEHLEAIRRFAEISSGLA